MAEWITTEEAAQLSGYNSEYLRSLIRSNKVKARKFGPVWQIDRASLLAYVKAASKTIDKRWGAKKHG